MTAITTTPTAIVFSTAAGSALLQDAIIQAQSSGLPLFIAKGVYTVAALTITAPVTIYAAKDTVQLKSSTGNAVSISIGSGVSSPRVAGVVLRGLNFDGELKPFAAGKNGIVQSWNADRLVVEDCFFWRSNSAGVYLHASEARIAGNRCDDCRVGIQAINCVGLTIENNYLTKSWDNGIYVYRDPYGTAIGFDGALIHGNRIYTVWHATGGSGQFGNAIICFQLQFIRITDNIISDADYSGIRVNYCQDVTVTGNQLRGIRETALFIENPGDLLGGWSNIVVSSNILNNTGGAISLANTNKGSRRAVVVGNTIVNTKKNVFPEWTSPDQNPANQYSRTTYGFGIMAASDCVVEGNTVESTDGPGIMLTPAGTWDTATSTQPDRNTVSVCVHGNILKYCEVGVGYSDTDTRTFAEIANNIIIGARLANIRKMQATNLNVPGNPNNFFGPFVLVANTTDQGNAATPVTDRWSFNRNKIVPATN